MATTRSSRQSLDPGVERSLADLASECGVTMSAAAAVAADYASTDPVVSTRAGNVLKAWRDGSAVRWEELTLPATGEPALTVNHARWVPEEPNPGTPFPRNGYGVRADWSFNDTRVVAAARGVFRARLPRAGAWIVAGHYGSIVAVAWGEVWGRTAAGRIYASEILIPDFDARDWCDEDGTVQGVVSATDRLFITAARDLIVYPPASRNPISWLTAEGAR